MNEDRVTPPRRSKDGGSVLPLVLVVVVVLGLVTAGIATYAATTLRYGQVVESRSDRLAAADGALREAIERLRIPNGNSPCLDVSGSDVSVDPFPIDINGAESRVECRAAGAGLAAVTQWALVLTGRGIGSADILSTSQAGGSQVNPKEIYGPVFVNQPGLDPDTHFDLKAYLGLVEGDLYFPGDSCDPLGDPVSLTGSNFDISPVGRSGICVQTGEISGGSPRAEPPRPDLTGIGAAPTAVDEPGCRVFFPGRYSTAPALSTDGNYFKSGNYVLEGGTLTIDDKDMVVTAGYPDTDAGLAYKITNSGCADEIAADQPGLPGADPIPGATFYLENDARLLVDKGKSEFLPRNQGGFDWVSIHTVGSNLTAGPAAEPVLRVTQGSGGGGNEGKEIVIQGWLWAPDAWIDFQNVTGQNAQVQLAGGGALARIHLGANASAGEFHVAVASTPTQAQYLLTSIADKDGGTSTITARVDYAPPNEVAVRSWRVNN